MDNNYGPYRLRDGWYCIVSGTRFGPWPDKGSATAGYQTEQRRADARLYGKPLNKSIVN
jgi:hypothetical protein